MNFATQLVVIFCFPKKHCRNNEKMVLFSEFSLDLPTIWMLQQMMILPSIDTLDFHFPNDVSTNMTVEAEKVSEPFIP